MTPPPCILLPTKYAPPSLPQNSTQKEENSSCCVLPALGLQPVVRRSLSSTGLPRLPIHGDSTRIALPDRLGSSGTTFTLPTRMGRPSASPVDRKLYPKSGRDTPLLRPLSHPFGAPGAIGGSTHLRSAPWAPPAITRRNESSSRALLVLGSLSSPTGSLRVSFLPRCETNGDLTTAALRLWSSRPVLRSPPVPPHEGTPARHVIVLLERLTDGKPALLRGYACFGTSFPSLSD